MAEVRARMESNCWHKKMFAALLDKNESKESLLRLSMKTVKTGLVPHGEGKVFTLKMKIEF